MGEPGQECIAALSEEVGIRLFPSWSEGAPCIGARAGVSSRRTLSCSRMATRCARPANLRPLATMAESVPSEAPWTAPRAAEWDAFTLHDWLCTHVESRAATHALKRRSRACSPATARRRRYCRRCSGSAAAIRCLHSWQLAISVRSGASMAAQSSFRSAWQNLSVNG